jgi:DNA-binding NtrC family response regulator
MPSRTVLVIDECPDILKLFQIGLSDYGFTVHTALSADQASKICEEHPLDAILADVDFLGESGLQLLARIKTLRPNARIYLMTAGLANYTTDDLMHLGVERCFSKPIQFSELVEFLSIGPFTAE